MKVFIIGVSGAIGGQLADKLLARGADVGGLVRSESQEIDLANRGVSATLGDLGRMSAGDLAAVMSGFDAIVYTAGSNGGARDVTRAIDGEGVEKALEAAEMAGVHRFALVSVLPESWREKDNGEEVEYYFAVKKHADIAVTRSNLDWVVLRPSLLLDEPAIGTISLGPAEFHGDVPRADVAEALAELLHEPRISRQILELNTGTTPIHAAVQANVRQG